MSKWKFCQIKEGTYKDIHIYIHHCIDIFWHLAFCLHFSKLLKITINTALNCTPHLWWKLKVTGKEKQLLIPKIGNNQLIITNFSVEIKWYIDWNYKTFKAQEYKVMYMYVCIYCVHGNQLLGMYMPLCNQVVVNLTLLPMTNRIYLYSPVVTEKSTNSSVKLT